MSDRYEIKSKIGAGGIGAVYRAFDTQLRREVAIKRLLNQEHKKEEARKTAEYLINEAGLLSKLQHPNIVTVFDVGLDDEGAFIVMEFIDGETMSETVKRGALTLKDFVPVVLQSLEALVCALEAGMLHRDIKPSNVMIRWLPSGRFQLKILDFGLAKISEQPSLQTIDHGNSILGSIYFMSPEQLEREPLDQRTDLYSLGCLLYYTLAGAFPFKGKAAPEVMVAHLEHDVVPIEKIRPDIPPSISGFIMSMMAFDRNDRPGDARMALSLFESMVAELPPSAYHSKPGSKTVTPPSVPDYEQTTSTHSQPTARRLVTGTSPHHPPLLSTTDHFHPPLKSQRKKKSSSAWILPVSIVATVLAGAAWFIFFRDSSNANVPEAPVYLEKEIVEIEAPPIPKSGTLIPFGASWQYPPEGNPPENWNTLGFDSSSWPDGNSPIGYGDAGVTKITLANPQPVSIFFRREFQSDRDKPEGLMELKLRADDGIVVFLNGYEAVRFGMPGGKIERNTLSVRSAFNESETQIFTLPVKRTDLRNGRNILCVEIHQSDKDSSDAHFDLQLRASGGRIPSPEDMESADAYAEVVPTSRTNPVQWSYRLNQPSSGKWTKSDYHESKTWKKANGAFKTDKVWKGENIWLRRVFTLSGDDLAHKDQLALSVLHDDDVTIFINGELAAERPGFTPNYIVLKIGKSAQSKLIAGDNVFAVHCLNNDGPGMIDVGIIRLDQKK